MRQVENMSYLPVNCLLSTFNLVRCFCFCLMRDEVGNYGAWRGREVTKFSLIGRMTLGSVTPAKKRMRVSYIEEGILVIYL